MKKLYTLFTCIFILSGINSQGQTACFTYQTFPPNAPMCEGITLIFDGSCSTGATSWDWDFGPNAIPSSSNLQFPGLVQFPVCGINNTVTLTINGGGSAALTYTQNIPIYCDPVACFTVNFPNVCLGTPVTFNSSCSQPGIGSTSLSYQWDLCDGSGPITANPTHTYTDTGCFCAKLIVTNNHGCTDFHQENNFVCVGAPPTFQISASATTTCQQNLSVDFCAPPISGGSSPYSYNWNFQGGTPTTSTSPCPTGINFTTGQWDVSCTVTDAAGCSNTVTLPNYINVDYGTPIFLTDDSVCVGECVTVETIPSSYYSWTVSPNTCVTPNTTQITPGVTYCFSCSGDYVVTINSVINGCALTDSVTVHVLDNPVACINIASNLPSCSFPQTVNVTYCGPPPVAGYQYLWSFPGGTPSSYSGAVLPNGGAISYNSCGHFSISLHVISSNGCHSTVTLTDTVKIDCPQACYTIADLPFQGQFCSPLTLHFDASCSLGSPTIYKWCVAPVGGAPCVPLSLGPTPALNFNSPGCYNVTLITVNAAGCTDTVVNPFTGWPICVGGHTQPCFTPTLTTTCAPLPVTFINCTPDSNGVNGGPGFLSCHSWCWNFGDGFGCQSNAMNPQHQFQDTGCFDIMLVSNNCGCSDTMLQTQYVCVLPPIPHINYSINCDTPNVVLFDGTSSIGIDTYIWSFPGGTPSISYNPIVYVTYPMPNPIAIHTASLIVCNNASSCCDSTGVTFFLRNIVDSVTVDTTVCFPETSSVTNYSLGANSYLWKIYDECNNGILISGMTSNAKSYNNNGSIGFITWPSPGVYHVVLKMTELNGCQDTLDWTVTVHGLSPGFWGSPIMGCAPITVSFHDTTNANCVSTPVAYSMAWGDNSGNSPFLPINQTVTHTYTSNGNFSVTEFVTDQYGCTDSVSIINYVPIGVLLSETHIDATSGNTDGSINLSAIGGTTPYNYLWNNGSTTQDINNLAAGNYSVTVTDVNGCSSSLNIILLTICPLTFNINSSDSFTCAATLSIDFCAANIMGGTPPYTYSWIFQGGIPVTSTDSCPQNINYSTGTYSVSCTITDANGCSNTVTLSNYIIVGAGVFLSTNNIDATCGNANGSIDLSVNGGIIPIEYNWSNSATTQDLNNLSAGNYSVTVTDANNCAASMSITIVNHPAPTISVNHIDASCLNCHNGSATVLINGGIPPYTIQWNTGNTGNPIINIDPGVYQVCVTDVNGCSVCDSVTVGYAIGINSITENDFVQIIPNPNNGIFTLHFSSSVKPEQIEVYNLLGEKIYALPNNEWKQNTQLNLSFLSDGIYFLKIESAQNLVMKKIVISRK